MNAPNTDEPGVDPAPTDACSSPVLFLVFNRPSTTKRVFDAIASARPPKLYVAADGPREHVPSDAARCNETRAIATSVHWPCQVYTKFRSHNLGCRVAVSDAIDWFFEQEPEGIVLEDDCLPHRDFFPFCDALLARYRDDDRVVSISGQGHAHAAGTADASYYFSVYNHCWGWASWRRAWRAFDRGIPCWPSRRESRWLHDVGGGSRQFTTYWRGIFDDLYAGRVDSWAYAWTYACWKHKGLSAIPVRNQVSNIGFGDAAAHTTNVDDPRSALATRSMDFPLVHPDTITVDRLADRRTGKEFFGITPTRMLVTSIKRTATGRWLMNAARFLASKVGRFGFRRQL